jgi:hypothetical protein
MEAMDHSSKQLEKKKTKTRPRIAAAKSPLTRQASNAKGNKAPRGAKQTTKSATTPRVHHKAAYE